MTERKAPPVANAIKGIKGFVSIPLMLRVAAAIELPDGQNGCWVWKKPSNNGYGAITIDGRKLGSHKAVYEHANGPVPRGLELDHLCKNTACCNPLHLEPVTHAENNKRGYADRRKTQCARGHAFTQENTILTKDGTKHCRACQKITKTAWDKKQKQARAALKAAE